MPNDERILNVLQQTLTEIQRMNTRLAKIETELDNKPTDSFIINNIKLVTIPTIPARLA